MKEVTSSYNATEIEEYVRQFWLEDAIFEKTKELHHGDPDFFFVDGPPYTTGHIHLGTAWNKIIKDSILRHTRMTGRNVIARAGYDMHGLPIEVRVEQQLGFVSKKDIEKFGIGKFIEQCRTFAATNMEIMSRQFMALGVWLDFEDPYQTMKPEYIEAAWWTLARAESEGMLERGHRVVNWCPRCATAIADSEVDYAEVTDPSIYVKFPVSGRDHEYLVIWTTTPWTLPANVAVAVHPDIIYARVGAVKDGRREILWIAEDLVEIVLRKGRYQDYSILEKTSGRGLTNFVYTSPIEETVTLQRDISHRVVTADFVTLENTGMVHIAPGHGWDDYLLGCREQLPIICPVDATGRFTSGTGTLSGMFIKDADAVVLDDLGNHLLARESVTHRYGHCWRCRTPIIFRATEQWFLKASEMRDRMLEEVGKVTWYPEWAGSARFYDWIKEARDWCISRQRYWGIPIPIWECRSCGKHRVFGTFRELEEASGQSLPDPHRPFVDEITLQCGCGGAMHRVEDIFDVWFDSAVASWATLRFPGEREAFDRLWPADFITEGQDQTRGWFYSQLGASTIAFGCSPFRSVLMHGFALDAEGRKMSKSLGNVVTPEEVVTTQGVDVLRLYVLSSSAPWDDLKFNWDGVKTVNRAINIFWNVYRFPLPYMILDNFSPASGSLGLWDDTAIRSRIGRMAAEDRWIISRINSCAAQVTAAMEERQLHRATRALIQFILEDLSRWYVQLVRPRMWLEGESAAKTDAYETMYYVLRRLCGLLAPFTPHITEMMFENIRTAGDPPSIHMTGWWKGDEHLVDGTLEHAMDITRSFDEASANARQAGKRKLRWPVREVVVVTDNDEVMAAIGTLSRICEDRANARIVRVVRGSFDRAGWRAEPVMKALGPAFGKNAPVVRDLIRSCDAATLKSVLDKGETVTLTDNGSSYLIQPGHVIFFEELPAGLFQAPMDGGTVYVDVALTDDLEAEGYSREVIRRIQEMRRLRNLNVEEYIRASAIIADERVASLLQGQWVEEIEKEVRAGTLTISSGSSYSSSCEWEMEKDWDVEGIPMLIGISKLADQPVKK
ncbi:MAG: isoleucine--tRNA ligase [Methanoregulaceae archaeon]|nr:isoleucine--tRNA ligase [Methanoregulaceae archaeon]